MLKEEKLTINRDIVNLISTKESYEEIVNSLTFENNNTGEKSDDKDIDKENE